MCTSGYRPGRLRAPNDSRGVHQRGRLGPKGRSGAVVAPVPVLDERNRLAIGRQRQLQGPELDVRQAPDLALFRIKDKHTRGLAQIGREDQIATVRSPPDVMDDHVLQAEPGAHANLLPLVMVHRVKPLRTVYVQQNRNRIPRRGRHNFLDPGPLEVGEGLRSLILNDRPAVDVILRDQLHPDERPVLGFGVYPIEAPPHIVPVQVYHQRIFVQPVGTPVFVARLPGDATSTRKRTPAIQVLPILSSERRPEILADAIGSPPRGHATARRQTRETEPGCGERSPADKTPCSWYLPARTTP